MSHVVEVVVEASASVQNDEESVLSEYLFGVLVKMVESVVIESDNFSRRTDARIFYLYKDTNIVNNGVNNGVNFSWR